MGMHSDIYIYDTERLYSIASDELVKLGLNYFSDKRLMGVALESGTVVRHVENFNEEQY